MEIFKYCVYMPELMLFNTNKFILCRYQKVGKTILIYQVIENVISIVFCYQQKKQAISFPRLC